MGCFESETNQITSQHSTEFIQNNYSLTLVLLFYLQNYVTSCVVIKEWLF